MLALDQIGCESRRAQKAQGVDEPAEPQIKIVQKIQSSIEDPPVQRRDDVVHVLADPAQSVPHNAFDRQSRWCTQHVEKIAEIPRVQSTGEVQISERLESALALHVNISVFVEVVEIDVFLPAQSAI